MENKGNIDSVLSREMFNQIRSAEIKNIKTQKQDDKGMTRIIEKYIYDKVTQGGNQNED